MEVEKIRNLSDDELGLEERKTSEQLFRLRFQMKLGQTEGVKKLRDLRKDIARIRTVARERELGMHLTPVSPAAEAELAREPASGEAAAGKKPTRKKAATAAGKAAARKTAAPKPAGRAAEKRASSGRTTKRAAARTGKVKTG
jgi:large subunit ribosomal protein L29